MRISYFEYEESYFRTFVRLKRNFFVLEFLLSWFCSTHTYSVLVYCIVIDELTLWQERASTVSYFKITPSSAFSESQIYIFLKYLSTDIRHLNSRH